MAMPDTHFVEVPDMGKNLLNLYHIIIYGNCEYRIFVWYFYNNNGHGQLSMQLNYRKKFK